MDSSGNSLVGLRSFFVGNLGFLKIFLANGLDSVFVRQFEIVEREILVTQIVFSGSVRVYEYSGEVLLTSRKNQETLP